MKLIISIILILFFVSNCFSQTTDFDYNYANGNGTILTVRINDNYKTTVRRHESRLRIYPGVIIAYDKPCMRSNKLFELKDGDYVTTSELACMQNLETNEVFNWVKVIDDINRTGWLNIDMRYDVYSDGHWAFLEMKDIGDKMWTIRKFNGAVALTDTLGTLYFRNNPGLIGTTILFNYTHTNDIPEPGVTILAIAEESDTIEGITDYWLKIKDNQNRIGWIFGYFTHVNRGGPKYRIPEATVNFYFNLP
jgi:hypothetical protein